MREVPDSPVAAAMVMPSIWSVAFRSKVSGEARRSKYLVLIAAIVGTISRV